MGDGTIVTLAEHKTDIIQQFEQFSLKGFRTIGICYKDVTNDPVIDKNDECNMTFLGFILLQDPPKEGIMNIINELKIKSVALKIITGDNTLIAENIASQIGIASHRIISGTGSFTC